MVWGSGMKCNAPLDWAGRESCNIRLSYQREKSKDCDYARECGEVFVPGHCSRGKFQTGWNRRAAPIWPDRRDWTGTLWGTESSADGHNQETGEKPGSVRSNPHIHQTIRTCRRTCARTRATPVALEFESPATTNHERHYSLQSAQSKSYQHFFDSSRKSRVVFSHENHNRLSEKCNRRRCDRLQTLTVR